MSTLSFFKVEFRVAYCHMSLSQVVRIQIKCVTEPRNVDALQVNLTPLGPVVSAPTSHAEILGFKTCLGAEERDQQHMEKILCIMSCQIGTFGVTV